MSKRIYIPVGGSLGHTIRELEKRIIALEAQSTAGTLTSKSNRGVTIRPLKKNKGNQGNSSAPVWL